MTAPADRPRTFHLGLDTALPERMAVQWQGTLYIAGWCFDEQQRVGNVEFVVDGEAQPVLAARMPRRDVYRRFGSPGRQAYRSGFWGLAELGARGQRSCPVSLRATVDGHAVEESLGVVALDRHLPPRRPPVPPAKQPLIAICMATYNPTAQDFERQVESIRRQSYENWVCVINDDHSETASFEMVRRVICGDERFVLHRNPRRLGFYANFGACLTRAPQEAEYVALSDQDDRWYPEKVATLLHRLQQDDAVLAYSDMRIVDEGGRVLRDTFWRLGHENNYTDLGALLYANTVTGAASLFSRRVIDQALPFPHLAGAYHDHWLACVALSLGRVSYIDRPLHDYVQHSRNVLGHLGRPGPENPGGRSAQHWYFTNVIGAMVFSREILARRGGGLTNPHRRVLWRVAQLDSPRGLAWLLVDMLRRPREIRGPKMLVAASWHWALAGLALQPTSAASVTKQTLPAVERSAASVAVAGPVEPGPAAGDGASPGGNRYSMGSGTHDVLVGLIPPGSRVLDLGCASGYIGARVAALGCTVTGVDVDPMAVREARAGGAYAQVVQLDLDEAVTPLPPGPYDVILCGDVLEHLRDPLSALERLKPLLAAGGKIVVSLPNVAHIATRARLLVGRFDYTDTGILDHTHLHLYTYDSAMQLLQRAGLDVEAVLGGSKRFGHALSFGPRPVRRMRGLLSFNIILVAAPSSGAIATVQATV